MKMNSLPVATRPALLSANPADAPITRVGDRVAVVALVILGIALRGYQYISNKSMYVDEVALAENIIGRTFRQLATSLDHNQVAPLGFLYLERIAVLAFGDSEYALRLLPFLAAVASVPLFWAVAMRCLPRPAALFALAMFAISPRLIYYAAEVKQYSSDIALVLALTLGALWVSENRASVRRPLAISVAGAIAIWFSHPLIFYLAPIGLYLLIGPIRNRDRDGMARIAVIGLMWVSSFAVSYIVSRRSLGDAQFMEGWWAAGFLPFPLRSSADLSLWTAVLAKPFREPLEFMLPAIAIPSFFVGVISLARRRPRFLVLLGGPLALAIVASILRLYPLGGSVPFSGRVVLYLAPVLILIIAEGAERVRSHLKIRPLVFAAVLAVGMVVPRLGPETLVPVYRHFPAAQSHLWLPRSMPIIVYPEYRPVLEELAATRLPGDAVYVYEGAILNYRYYARRLDLNAGGWIHGRTRGDSPEEVARDLAPLLGRGRVWIFLTNTWRGEEQHFVAILGRPLAVIPGQGAIALLYDFGPASGMAGGDG